MKKPDLFSLVLGLVLGLILAGSVPFIQRATAEDAKKEGLTKAEYDRKIEEFTGKVDEVLASQKKLQEHINLILDQSDMLRKVCGK